MRHHKDIIDIERDYNNWSDGFGTGIAVGLLIGIVGAIIVIWSFFAVR